MRKSLIRLILTGTLALTACAPMNSGQFTWDNPEGRNRVMDDLTCRALANQAAGGAGDWSSDRALRKAINDTVVQQNYNQCAEGLGYRKIAPR